MVTDFVSEHQLAFNVSELTHKLTGSQSVCGSRRETQVTKLYPLVGTVNVCA